MGNTNPFEEGRQAALAGKSFKAACPYDQHSKLWNRWNCGYQAGVIEIRKATPKPPQQMALLEEVLHGA